MTETEKIADVVVAAVRAATLPLVERIAVLEARAPIPGPPGDRGDKGEPGAPGPAGLDGEAGAPGRDGIDGKEAPAVDVEAIAARAAALIPVPKDGRDGIDGKDGAHGVHGKDAQEVDVDDVARRAAALVPKAKDGVDGRDGQPGVPGAPGRDGAPGERGERGEKGIDGKDGRDGTLEGASIEQVDDRTFRVLRADGSALGLMKFAILLDRGVYQAARTYEKGDGVTYAGSFWIAQDATNEKPGDGATKWRLAVKAGRDGREGKPGRDGAIGPKGERGDPGRNFS